MKDGAFDFFDGFFSGAMIMGFILLMDGCWEKRKKTEYKCGDMKIICEEQQPTASAGEKE